MEYRLQQFFSEASTIGEKAFIFSCHDKAGLLRAAFKAGIFISIPRTFEIQAFCPSLVCWSNHIIPSCAWIALQAGISFTASSEAAIPSVITFMVFIVTAPSRAFKVCSATSWTSLIHAYNVLTVSALTLIAAIAKTNRIAIL